MRIAAVSTDGINVDEHFGKATRLLVYDVDEGSPRFVANRPISPLSTGDPEHTFNPGGFASIAEVLEDCDRVYCTRIGEKPAKELKTCGIDAVVYQGPIDQIAP